MKLYIGKEAAIEKIVFMQFIYTIWQSMICDLEVEAA